MRMIGPDEDQLRPIGLLERFHVTRNFLGLDSCVVASARYLARDKQVLTDAVVFPALRQVVLAHPPLCVKLQNETSSNACFVPLRRIDLSDVVQFSQRGELQTVLQDHLARGFDAEADLPLWRVEVLPDNTVVFAVHHVVGDGLSTVAFLLALLQALEHPTTDETLPSIRIPTGIVLSPPIEELTNVRPSFGQLLSLVYKHFAPERWTPASSAWTGRKTPQTAAGGLKTQVRLLNIPPEQVVALRTACRKHRATLTSAFYVLATSTLSRILAAAKSNGRRYRSVSAGVAISLRDCSRVPLPRTTICDAVSAHYTYPALNPNFSWTTASRYAGVLRKQRLGGARGNIGMLRFLGNDYARFMRGHLGAKREGGFVISNLGPMPISEAERTWSMENVVFAQCDVVVGAAFKMNIVGDTDGGVNFAFTWGEESVEEFFVEEFISRFRDALGPLFA
ncbi:alcohol acetyltransferase-domain-containing protein [Mycena amicta]|nr:alcohol acetyltransferase-domain-containing protein [Mycena amicta]